MMERKQTGEGEEEEEWRRFRESVVASVASSGSVRMERGVLCRTHCGLLRELVDRRICAGANESVDMLPEWQVRVSGFGLRAIGVGIRGYGFLGSTCSPIGWCGIPDGG